MELRRLIAVCSRDFPTLIDESQAQVSLLE